MAATRKREWRQFILRERGEREGEPNYGKGRDAAGGNVCLLNSSSWSLGSKS